MLFAALSRGAGRIRGRAAAGLWTGIAGLVLGTLMTVLWMVMLAGGGGMRDRVKWKAAARICPERQVRHGHWRDVSDYGGAVGGRLAVEVLVLGGTFALAFQDSSALYLGYMAAVMAVSYLVQFGLVYLMLPGYLRVMLQIARRGAGKGLRRFLGLPEPSGAVCGHRHRHPVSDGSAGGPRRCFCCWERRRRGQFLFASLYLLCYSLLLTVLLLYVQLTFAMFYFLLVQNPDMGIWQALMESRRMMRGRRGRFFVLTLSFLGWTLVGAATFGIGFLWLGALYDLHHAAVLPGRSGSGREKPLNRDPTKTHRIHQRKKVVLCVLRISELKRKEVINTEDCRRLGFVGDVDFDMCSGCMTAVIVPGPGCLCGFLGREKEYVIPLLRHLPGGRRHHPGAGAEKGRGRGVPPVGALQAGLANFRPLG